MRPPRPLPSLDELHAHLEEAGVQDAPRDAPDEDHLQGLLALALHVADCQKRVAFPDFSWTNPHFVAEDAKVRLKLVHARLHARDEPGIRELLMASLPRLGHRALLALDARPSGLAEFELGHMLYGQVTLFEHRQRPHESADPRIHAAREKGWTPTLKEHNLVPGRGLSVLDEHHGLLLREPWLDELLGLLVLLPSGETRLMWNPFSKHADPDLQYWLAWGRGTGSASYWREVLRVDEAE